MTAVAPPPNFQPIARTGWSPNGGAPNGLNSMSEDVSRMFMPRKSAQRSNSSSSFASQSSGSSTSTITTQQPQLNGATPTTPADSGWATRKKPITRSLWPSSKAEPISGLSTARTQPVPNPPSGPSAASAISALHTPNSMLPSQHGAQAQPQTAGAPRQAPPNDIPAILHLLPMNGTFERKTISVPFYPDVVRIGRQTNAKTQPTPLNGYFDSKVLSRQHAEVWADRSGKIWIRDIKSSNGTFVNGQRLSQENRDSDPHELREQDMLELGIDIVSEDQKTVVHHKVAARVEHAGIYNNGANFMDLNLGDLDPSAGGFVNPSMQGIPMRGRAGSAGSMGSNGRMGSAPGSVAGSNASAHGQQRSMNFWLTPVTVEQIVKRLNTELKQAKHQSQDLNRTNKYMEDLLQEPKKDSKANRPSPVKDNIRTRFADPPAPPPQQPLPEKPDSQRSLQRSDTERPKLVSYNSVPVHNGNSTQITSLVEALGSAKREIDSQSVRLKDLEDRLEHERILRESAEERAHRLESESRMNGESESPILSRSAEPLVNGVHLIESEKALQNGVAPDADTATTRLQARLDLMMQEMDEMKVQMEKYKLRAETAEEASAKDRRTLAEMVESIRQREEASRSRKPRGRSGSPSISNSSSTTLFDSDSSMQEKSLSNGTLVPPRRDASRQMGEVLTALMQAGSADVWLKNTGLRPGETVDPHQMKQLETILQGALLEQRKSGGVQVTHSASKVNSGELVQAHAAPFASMLGVVIVGVGIMAWLNGWQRVER